MSRSQQSHLSLNTIAVTSGRASGVGAPLGAQVEFSSTYRARELQGQDGDQVYGRFANPAWTAFEQTLAALEGGPALLFGSGMAAISAVLAQVPHGARVVAPQSAYSGTVALLHRLRAAGRIELTEVPIADTAATIAAFSAPPAPAMVLLESPTNPLMDVADLPALIEAAHAAGAVVAVDNTFATPLGQRPLDLGADLVLHSVTKYLSGHSDVVLGALAWRDDDRWREPLTEHRLLNGAIAGPMEAMLALRGVRTLAVRLDRACANAMTLAERLLEHPAVLRVRYPGLPGDPGHERASAQMRTFGAMVSIEVRDAEAAEQVCANTRIWAHATSLGGVESSLERRRRHAMEPVVVPEGLIRLSVGIEDVEDLWRDLDDALRGDDDQRVSSPRP